MLRGFHMSLWHAKSHFYGFEPCSGLPQHQIVVQEIYKARSPKLDLVKHAMSQLLQAVALEMPELEDILESGLSSSTVKQEWRQSSGGLSDDPDICVGLLVGKILTETAQQEDRSCLPAYIYLAHTIV